jgi:tetratricopeptide (TPR) repeat protein
MATKRKVVKKDIKRDPLVTYSLKASQYVQKHFNQVIVGVAVLVALLAVVMFTANSRRSSAVQSDRQLAQALSLFQQGDFQAAKVTFGQISDRYGGRNGAIAEYYAAESNLGERNYSQALLHYETYLDDASKFPEFKAAALYGIALCHEGLENFSLAAESMEQVFNSVDEGDPRYLDSAYLAGELFAKAGNNERAVHYFQTVADNASGNLKDKATVAVTLLSSH